MVSVMHSAIGGFSDEELAIIKACDKKVEKRIYDGGSFYEILFRSRLAEDHPDLSQKVSDFIDMIDDFRDKAVYLPVNELIRYILDSTGYKEYCAALPGGEKRLANIDMLIEKAADFEKTSYRGVFHFVRYIEELAKYEVDYGEANTLDENADVVRIMSIHKSKGLEFPVVFLAGMAKNFNFMDTSKPLCLDMDLGIGTYGFDVKNRVKYVTLRKSTMEDCMKNDIIAEEMRILYVAMTRAKKKVILVTLKDRESDFLRELHDKYAEEMKQEAYICPLCGGKLKHKTGKFGEFFGCENYKTTGCRYTRNIRRKGVN
jgi:ATP-dependent helicase/nuclease subunit A